MTTPGETQTPVPRLAEEEGFEVQTIRGFPYSERDVDRGIFAVFTPGTDADDVADLNYTDNLRGTIESNKYAFRGATHIAFKRGENSDPLELSRLHAKYRPRSMYDRPQGGVMDFGTRQ